MLMSSVITLFCIYVDDQYAPLLFVNLIFWGLLMRNVRCDACGTALVPPIGGSFLRIVKSLFSEELQAVRRWLGLTGLAKPGAPARRTLPIHTHQTIVKRL